MVDPIPEDANLDLFTIIELVFLEFFTFVVMFVLLRVAISLAGPVVDTPNILNSLLPLVNLNLSGVNSSNPPSEFIRTYLSSSYGKNVSLAAA